MNIECDEMEIWININDRLPARGSKSPKFSNNVWCLCGLKVIEGFYCFMDSSWNESITEDIIYPSHWTPIYRTTYQSPELLNKDK